MKISKKEWEEFQNWLKEKQKLTNQKIEEESIEIEPNLIEEIIEETEEEEENYICGNCGYESNKQFEVCPNCNKKMKWD